MATTPDPLLTPAQEASIEAIAVAAARVEQIRTSAESVCASRGAIHAVEQVPGGFTRPTRVSVQSRALGLRVLQDIGYVWPVTDRRWGAESGRSAWIVEAL